MLSIEIAKVKVLKTMQIENSDLTNEGDIFASVVKIFGWCAVC